MRLPVKLAALLLVVSSAAVASVAIVLRTAPPMVVQARAVGQQQSMSRQPGTERTFTTTDSVSLMGAQLFVRSRGTVIFVHGLGEADSLFSRWAGAAASSTGMNVIGFSLRGSGLSRDSLPRRAGAGAFATDLGSVIRELKRRNPSGPVLLLASHGGLGITAGFVAAYAKAPANQPRADGIIALDVGPGDEARVPNGRPFLVYPRRIRLISALASAGLHWLDGYTVAEQSGTPRFLSTRWSYADWEASAPQLDRLLAALSGTDTPLLVVSNAPSPNEDTPATATPARTWQQLAETVDLNSPTVSAAVLRWAAVFSADAYEPTPPKATQTLDVLRPR